MSQMYGKVTRLHIELSSRCNASCPCCSRNFCGGPVVPDLDLTELSLADIKQMIPNELAAQLHAINFCGNIGDPGMATDLIEILEHFRDQSPNIILQVRTNGGMRSAEFWTKLGNFFKNHQANNMDPIQADGGHLFGRSNVVFSVDGLEETNHIYRRGVIWEKLIRNMQAYSDTGATATWEWLLFDHNKHQIDEAHALAKKLNFDLLFKNPMGFTEHDGIFKPIPVYSKAGKYEYSIWPNGYSGEKIVGADSSFDFVNHYITQKQNKNIPVINEFSKSLENNTITCRSTAKLDQGEVYISAGGYMLPCCYLGSVFGQNQSSYSRYQFNSLMQDYGLEKFNLRTRPMTDILKGPEFSKFFLDGWSADTIKNGKLLYCIETCGQSELNSIDKLYPNKIISKDLT